MKIKDSLLSSYSNTCHHYNVDNIEQGFMDYNQFDLIYELINFIENDNLSVKLIYSDSGVREFQIHYTIGNFVFLLADWNYNKTPFESFNDFCIWLQNKVNQMPALEITETLKFK